MRVVYRLSERVAGFDFFPWLVMERSRGATEVVLDTRNPNTGKWSPAKVAQRIDSILAPGAALAGMTCSIGWEGDMEPTPGYSGPLVEAVRAGLVIPRLKSVLPAGSARYTITMRREERAPSRNSDPKVWGDFAAEIGALIIPDYGDAPIHLHDRMALYAGAEMNFFVTNGPVMLGFLSEYPTMGFDVSESPPKHVGLDWRSGEKYPWLLPQHRQFYERPTAEFIRDRFYAWRDGRG